MPKSYAQLMKQIDALRDQAESVRRKEVAGVVKRIKEAIAVSVVKYRDEAGHTWSGKGPRPGWLKAALASGKTLADLSV